MIKILIQICICVSFCLFASCSAQAIKERNFMSNAQTLQKCAGMNRVAQEGRFTLELVDNETCPSDEEHTKLFPYPTIVVTPKFSKFEPGLYTLYCPNTGCPFQPKFVARMRCNENNAMRMHVEGLEDILTQDDALQLSVFLWGIPDFCSDWYLSRDNTKEVFHAVFTYQPIAPAKSVTGKTLSMCKKECGGNFLEVQFSGFAPNELVNWSSDSCGEVQQFTIKMDEKGSGSSILCPAVQGQQRGHVTVCVQLPDERLEVGCDWDSKTLLIRSH